MSTAAPTTQTYYDRFSQTYEDHRHHGYHRMIDELAVLIFFAVDLGAVVLALVWLSERRAMRDPTDARYRGRRRIR